MPRAVEQARRDRENIAGRAGQRARHDRLSSPRWADDEGRTVLPDDDESAIPEAGNGGIELGGTAAEHLAGGDGLAFLAGAAAVNHFDVEEQIGAGNLLTLFR